MDAEPKLCYVCGVPLPPGGSRRIGTCLKCMRESVQKPEKAAIKAPGYSKFDGEPDQGLPRADD